ncbi:MAG: type II secretion system protein [Candidatus Gracilibacteria bacterium]|nr:type II secretion system protein [Candidatus Gracilibacteria bacterium]
MKQQIKAFTLVELIIVITILAILTTIGFMSYQSHTSDARDSSRITSLKTVHKGLTISYLKKQIYPTPDDYIDIVGVSKQGYVGETVSKAIRGNSFKDPKDNTRFLYSLDYTGKKIELSGYLENNNKIILSQNNPFFNQAFARNIDYTNRYLYTIGDNVGILLNSTTNAPVNETIYTGAIDLQTDTQEYKVVFSSTGTISGSGQTLLTNISIIQDSCVLGNTVVINGGQISAYNTTSVAYNETCTPVSRTCNGGVLNGDISYKYYTCAPANALNCTRTTYNGYSIPNINHGLTQTISKAVTGGVSNIDATCTNGVLSYGTETTTCSTNYTLTGNSCIANTRSVTCGGSIPTNATAATRTTYTQTWNGTIWAPTTSWGASQSTCDFNCNTNYAWNGTSCVANTQSCIITNGIGSQTWNGTDWGTCTVIACNTGYSISGNSCVTNLTNCQIKYPLNSVIYDNWSSIPYNGAAYSVVKGQWSVNGTYCKMRAERGNHTAYGHRSNMPGGW